MFLRSVNNYITVLSLIYDHYDKVVSKFVLTSLNVLSGSTLLFKFTSELAVMKLLFLMKENVFRASTLIGEFMELITGL